MKHQTFRQGDVLIQSVDNIPTSAIKQQPQGRIILAYGEATLHHHSIDADAADWWKSADEDAQYVDIKESTDLVHQEHAAVALAPGKFRVTRQREYSPAAIRNVAD